MINIEFLSSNTLNYNSLKIKYKGLIFYKNYLNGNMSIKEFLTDYKNDWLNNIDKLHGNFVLNIVDKNNNYIFTDNSGMSRLYYYKNNVYDKFLLLAKDNKLTKEDINYYGLVEFIQFGYNIFHTLLKNTFLLEREQYIVIKNGKLFIKSKNIGSIFDKKKDIDEFYKNLEYNLDNKKIACDLTAGIDSRLNVSMLHKNNINFKTSISGVKEHIDVKKCYEISNILNKEVLYYDMPSKLEKNIFDDLFQTLDAQYSILEYYKNFNLSNGLINDNINLRISGAGGELYKYSWIIMDFPFFNKKKYSLTKIYNNRFISKSTNYNFYSNKIKKIISKYQAKLLLSLENYKEKNNTKTCDRICYETIMIKGGSTQMIQSTNNYIRYCPLLEYAIINNGINLKIIDRILYMLHRKKITNYTPEISKIKTNIDLSVNNSLLSIMKDGLCLIKRYLIKIKNKIFNLNKTVVDKANNKEIYDFCRKNDTNLINILKNNNIIKDYDENKIDNVTYSRLITIAKFFEYLEENND